MNAPWGRLLLLFQNYSPEIVWSSVAPSLVQHNINTTTPIKFPVAARLSKSTVGLKILGSPGWPQLLSSQNNRKTIHVSSLSGCALRGRIHKLSSIDSLLLFLYTIPPLLGPKGALLLLMCCACRFYLSKEYQNVDMSSFPHPGPRKQDSKFQ